MLAILKRSRRITQLALVAHGYSFLRHVNEYKNVFLSSVDALFAEILSLNATEGPRRAHDEIT